MLLPEPDVTGAPDNCLVSAGTVCEDGGDVGHGARGDPEGSLLAEEGGGVLLETLHRRVLAIDVVPYLCRQTCRAGTG